MSIVTQINQSKGEMIIMKNLKKIQEDVIRANGNRRERTLTLEQIIAEIEAKVSSLKVLSKNVKYIQIQNKCVLPNSYKYTAYYTHYIATLTNSGKIASIEVSERRATKYDNIDEILISDIDVGNIARVDLTNANPKTVTVLRNAILGGQL
jgi:hypothetical protein